MTASTSKRTPSPAKTATKPSFPSPRSVGPFRQLDAYMRTHSTLEDHIQAGIAALPAFAKQQDFLLVCGFIGGTSLLMAWTFYFAISAEEKELLPWTPQAWAVNAYEGADVAMLAVFEVVVFVLMLPLRAFAAFLSAFCITFFVLSPFMLAALVLVPLVAYCTFGDVFPFLPTALVRLLDCLSLPLLFHFLTAYFSISLFAPYTAHFPLLYTFLTLTALFDLYPFRFVVRALAKVEDALATIGCEEAEKEKVEEQDRVEALQGELERLMEEVERLKGSKNNA
ncbi:hypothetical protein JCM6882_004518 [Rhodosporidiobolus microsporus]